MVQDIRSEEVNAAPKNIPATPSTTTGRVSSRGPDGFLLAGQGQRREYGPLPDPDRGPRRTWSTAASPTSNRERRWPEAEDELGISGWIDPDTGAPAEEGAPHQDH
ncbi:MAG: hypothetical protein M5R42_04385 [Rhodocyclaceae bacterium]|nr:hypothetical protein [Rhodocyclaceae bacterium]